MGIILCKSWEGFLLMGKGLGNIFRGRGLTKAGTEGKAKAKAGPSLRLKNGYGQDDTAVVGWDGCSR
jgi:hypothetical protein